MDKKIGYGMSVAESMDMFERVKVPMYPSAYEQAFFALAKEVKRLRKEIDRINNTRFNI